MSYHTLDWPTTIEAINKVMKDLEPTQPDYETKLRTLAGEHTGWDYYFIGAMLPCQAHYAWNDDDWIRYIGDHWFRVR